MLAFMGSPQTAEWLDNATAERLPRALPDANITSEQAGDFVRKVAALMFHAKDDLPEVRREVFALLRKHELRFLAVVRNKQRVLEYVRRRNAVDLTYRYQPNELYDYMVRVLFKNLLRLLHPKKAADISGLGKWLARDIEIHSP